MILGAQPEWRFSKPTSQTPLICHTDSVITESAPPPGSREDQRQEEPKQPQPVDPLRKSPKRLFNAAPSSPRHCLRCDAGRSKKCSWQVSENPSLEQRALCTLHTCSCSHTVCTSWSELCFDTTTYHFIYVTEPSQTLF